MIRLHLGYPEFADEMNLLKDRHTANPLDSVRQVADKEALLKMQKEAVAVHMADSLYEYVTRLSRATREHAMITLGLSSRGALAVCRMAKAHAYMEGRDYAVPEDVAAIFADVSGHRVILSPKAKMTRDLGLLRDRACLRSHAGGGPRGVRGMWKARLTYGLWLVGAALLYVFTDRYYALVLLLARPLRGRWCAFCAISAAGWALRYRCIWRRPRPRARRPREC